MIYAGTSVDGRTDLYIIRNGALTGCQCRDEILNHTAVPLAAATENNFMIRGNYQMLHHT